jgi:hypothetical protein
MILSKMPLTRCDISGRYWIRTSDLFCVSQDRAAPDGGAERGERSREYLSGRATRLVSSLVSSGLTAPGEQAGRAVGRI